MDVKIQMMIKDYNPEQRNYFQQEFNSRRKDETTGLVLTVLGCVVIAGLQRFYLGQVGMGLLYLFTAGLLFIGTIIDLTKIKNMIADFNYNEAQKIAMEMQMLKIGLPSGTP